MLTQNIFDYLLYGWIGIALVIFPVMLKITAPYGRHTKKTWGMLINARLGWFIMELPVILVFSYFFFRGDALKTLPVFLFYSLFMLHYVQRVFIYPLRIREKHKKMPLLIVILAVFFNCCNGFFNGYWFGYLNGFHYSNDWLFGWKFILGFCLFIIGMYLNIASDQRLINLRNGSKKEYSIPYGGLFNYVSSPNLLGEIIEWTGWAVMCWCLPALAFAFWTFANLVPRALDHHRWYKKQFNNYPEERKAIFPFLL